MQRAALRSAISPSTRRAARSSSLPKRSCRGCKPRIASPPNNLGKDVALPIPVQFNGRLSIPAVAAPMFLVSNPDLVVECCRAGIIGTFPALNCRTSEAYEAWLVETRERLDRIERDTGRPTAPFGVNLIVHKSNPRLEADLALSV